MTKKERDEYLLTPEWKRTAAIAKVFANYRCQLCDKKGIELNAHHRRYGDYGKPEEILDLIVLCKPCHSNYHGFLPQLPWGFKVEKSLCIWIDYNAPAAIVDKLSQVLEEYPGVDSVRFAYIDNPENSPTGRVKWYGPSSAKISFNLLRKLFLLQATCPEIHIKSSTTAMFLPEAKESGKALQ